MSRLSNIIVVRNFLENYGESELEQS
jgi:hypothetical protein